jgi:hypothetical protein
VIGHHDDDQVELRLAELQVAGLDRAARDARQAAVGEAGLEVLARELQVGRIVDQRDPAIGADGARRPGRALLTTS